MFMETEPQSNKYHQVIFNKEQFKRASGSIADKTGERFGEYEKTNVILSKKTYDLHDLKQIYE